MGIGTLRRYYAMKAEAAREEGREAVVLAFEAKRAAEPVTPLPPDFPYLDRLQQRGYQGVEDLQGADVGELVSKGFTRRQARQILEALEQVLRGG